MRDASAVLAERLLYEADPRADRLGQKVFMPLCYFIGLGIVLLQLGREQGLELEYPGVSLMNFQYMRPAGARQFPRSARSPPQIQPVGIRKPVQPAGIGQSMRPAATGAHDAVAAMPTRTAVLDALDAGSDDAVRGALATTLPLLEASNPTSDPARSDLLSGKWTVKYTGAVAKGPVDSPTREIALMMYAAGFGPGAGALSLAKRLPDDIVQVKALSLEVLPGESRAKLGLRFLNGQADADVELVCELVDGGPATLIERGKEVIVNDGSPLSIPPQLRYTRDLYVTYLDNEILVVRDATGSPDILVREATSFVDHQFGSAAAVQETPAEIVTPSVEPIIETTAEPVTPVVEPAS